jgi:hypothetical protein
MRLDALLWMAIGAALAAIAFGSLGLHLLAARRPGPQAWRPLSDSREFSANVLVGSILFALVVIVIAWLLGGDTAAAAAAPVLAVPGGGAVWLDDAVRIRYDLRHRATYVCGRCEWETDDIAAVEAHVECHGARRVIFEPVHGERR